MSQRLQVFELIKCRSYASKNTPIGIRQRHSTMNDNSSTAFSLSSRLISLITSWLPLLVVLMVAMFAHFTIETRTQIVTTESDERVKVIFAENSLGRDLSNAISDLKFLAAYLGERGFNAGVFEADAMAELFSNLLTEKVLYDQARFIGRDGREVLRINFSEGVSSRVDESFLQDKASRYYVRESLSLDKGQIYISPLDLNIELGQIERPLKPMMRFAAPVFSPDGERQGIVVLNYLGRKMLDAFSRSGPGTTDHLHLLNNEGFWLSSPGGYEEWGFMLPHGKRFKDFFPSETWSALSQEDAGQIVNKEGCIYLSPQ